MKYAEHLIQDLEDHFEKSKKTKRYIVSAVTQCSINVAHYPVTKHEAYDVYDSFGYKQKGIDRENNIGRRYCCGQYAY